MQVFPVPTGCQPRLRQVPSCLPCRTNVSLSQKNPRPPSALQTEHVSGECTLTRSAGGPAATSVIPAARMPEFLPGCEPPLPMGPSGHGCPGPSGPLCLTASPGLTRLSSEEGIPTALRKRAAINQVRTPCDLFILGRVLWSEVGKGLVADPWPIGRHLFGEAQPPGSAGWHVPGAYGAKAPHGAEARSCISV